jgi:hypothetical protein
LGPNIFVRICFSKIFRICSPLNDRHLCISISIVFENNRNNAYFSVGRLGVRSTWFSPPFRKGEVATPKLSICRSF